MKVLVLDLPQPVSANRIWRTTRAGRTYLNPKYKAWRSYALSCLWEQKPAGGFPFFERAFDVRIIMPVKLRADIDNMIKPLLDFLAEPARIIANDKHTNSASISRSAEVAKGMCRVFVYETKEAA